MMAGEELRAPEYKEARAPGTSGAEEQMGVADDLRRLNMQFTPPSPQGNKKKHRNSPELRISTPVLSLSLPAIPTGLASF